jgi:methionine-rich copper-binding protein CopC
MPARPRTGLRRTVLAIATLLALSVPGSVAAHAELAVATPLDGATVEGTPTEVAGTFTQDLTVDGSSLLLRDPSGAVIAKGGVDPNDVRRMVIADLPTLPPGVYEVRWTTTSAEDDEVARDTWTFTVTAPSAPPPTASAVPTATSAPTAGASSATAPAPSADDATPASPSPAPSAASTPAPIAGSDGQGTDGLAAALPIVAAFAIVAATSVALLRRRGRTTPPA